MAKKKAVSAVHTGPIIRAFDKALADLDKLAAKTAEPARLKRFAAKLKRARTMMPGCPQTMAFQFANKIDKKKDR